ncbi:probable pectate lyase 8 [Tanacetum coccineum]
MNSFKTIDARGVNVHIANGACLTIQFVTNIIIHGLHIHDCKPTENALVRSSIPIMVGGQWLMVTQFPSLWVDHNSLSNCAVRLVDVVMGSTAITISNNTALIITRRSYSKNAKEMYAIGGSVDPTINRQGNRFTAPNNPFAKEVTKRVDTDRSNWHGWNCRSEGDLLLNGAYFIPSGAGSAGSYARASSLGAKSSSLVGTITANAGVISCRRGGQC